MDRLKIYPAGDQALVAEFGNVISEQLNRKVLLLKNCLVRKKIEGITELLPTYRSLMIFYDDRRISYKALKMGESNACMKRIVAAPTAGSCGVIPSVLISYEECFHESAKRIVEALYVCAGIGEVIAENASISGAQGGCQAEIGSAAAMAGGALVYLSGGNNQQISDAVALVLKGMLGLVCDPVCGLVEVPCIKRNVTGAVNAISASQLAMAGIHSVIPADEVIDAMRRVGNQLPECLKETAQGGLATSKKALKISKKQL